MNGENTTRDVCEISAAVLIKLVILTVMQRLNKIKIFFSVALMRNKNLASTLKF